jgi:CubicO group peptidase (beta-lactamase class C family)
MRNLKAVAAMVVVGLCVPLSGQMMKVPAGYFDSAVQPYVDSHQYMGSVLLARGENVMLNKGFGSANLTPATANSPATRFPIGSLTKQFTAAAILLLEERGKLSLADRIAQHLQGAPPQWSTITVHQLLTHTSGIPNTTTAAPGQSAATTPASIVAEARKRPVDFAPGERFNYSNTGYIILGTIIERLSTQPYGEFVRSQLFMPLGMKDSGYLGDGGSTSLAVGYVAGAAGPAPFPAIGDLGAGASGALYSTAEDLRRWQVGLFGGKLLSAASLQKMITPEKNDYALGLESRIRNGQRVIEHSGGYGAFRNMMAYYPDTKVSVIVLGNMGSAASEIAERLGAMAHGQAKVATQATAAAAVTVSPSTLAGYAGTYSIRNDDVVVSIEGGALTLQTGAGRWPLKAESDTRFVATSGDARIEFVVDANGVAPGVVLRQGGMMMKGSRKPQ